MTSRGESPLQLGNVGTTLALIALAFSNLVPSRTIPRRIEAPPATAPVQVENGLESARLWEDPFAIAAAAPTVTVEESAEGVRMLLGGRPVYSFSELVVIPVLLPLGGDAERAEFRRRTRTALHYAGSVLGEYSARNEALLWQPSDSETRTVDLFVSDIDDLVAFLWINPRQLKEPGLRGVERLAVEFADFLRDVSHPLGWEIEEDFRTCLVGPWSSDDLLTILKQSSPTLSDPAPEQRSGKRDWYSPWATVASGTLLELLGAEVSEGSREEHASELSMWILHRTGWHFERTTTTDDLLGVAWSKEMEKRSPSNAVWTTWLAEVDSLYSGALINEEGEASFQGFAGFQRGVDGSRLRETRGQHDGAVPLGYPVGPDQSDYMLRSAGHGGLVLSDEGEVSRRDLRTVGIQASEVADKLAVLHAWRPSYPDAIFFTSDLDARYLDPMHRAVTRNLVVVSHFGLQLKEELQFGLPPFRDSYQTATYFSGLRIFDMADPIHPETEPRVFEVGKGVAVDLSPSMTCDEVKAGSPHPEPARESPLFSGNGKRKWAFLGAVLLAGLIASQLLVRRTMFDYRGLRDVPWVPALIGLVVLAGAIGMVRLAEWDHKRGGEPWLGFAGVSVWPTQFVRYLAAMLTIAMLLRARHWFRRVTGQLERIPSVVTTPEWKKFRERGRRVRAIRLATGMFFLLLMYWLLRVSFGYTMAPARGDLAQAVDRWSGRIALGLLLLQIVWTGTVFQEVRQLFQSLRERAARQTARELSDAIEELEGQAKVLNVLSKRVYPLIYFPALTVLLLVLARSTWFDRWAWSPAMLTFMGLVALAVWIMGFGLRRSARRLRDSLCQHADRLQQAAEGMTAADAVPCPWSARAAAAASAMRAQASGVFASPWHDPVLRALLVPVSGLGALQLLEQGVLPF